MVDEICPNRFVLPPGVIWKNVIIFCFIFPAPSNSEEVSVYQVLVL